MNRDGNGRFIKKYQIEISIPSPIALCKTLILIIIFLPWIYIIFYRFDVLRFFEELFSFMMGAKEFSQCENSN